MVGVKKGDVHNSNIKPHIIGAMGIVLWSPRTNRNSIPRRSKKMKIIIVCLQEHKTCLKRT